MLCERWWFQTLCYFYLGKWSKLIYLYFPNGLTNQQCSLEFSMHLAIPCDLFGTVKWPLATLQRLLTWQLFCGWVRSIWLLGHRNKLVPGRFVFFPRSCLKLGVERKPFCCAIVVCILTNAYRSRFSVRFGKSSPRGSSCSSMMGHDGSCENNRDIDVSDTIKTLRTLAWQKGTT